MKSRGVTQICWKKKTQVSHNEFVAILTEIPQLKLKFSQNVCPKFMMK